MDAANRQSMLPTIQTTHHGDPTTSRTTAAELRSASTSSLGGKRRSFLAKTFRKVSGSTSSTDLASMSEDASGGLHMKSKRVLHKNNGSGGSNSSSIFYRINRRASKDSSASSHMSEEAPNYLSPQPPSNPVRVLKHGPLKTDSRLWKSRAEYVVLTDGHLIKFSSVEAARSNFTELAPPTARLKRSSTSSTLSQDGTHSDGRVEIPLCRIVNIFNEEGVSPHFGLDVWWSETSPLVSWACTKLFFEMPAERDDWMSEIRHAIRESVGSSTVPKGLIASNVEAAIYAIVATEEPPCRGCPLDIFPVVHRTTLLSSKAENTENAKKSRDGSSYYLLLGQNKCYLIRVARTSVYKAPQDIDINTVAFGLTSLVRLKATMVPHEERFVLGFRLPCENEKRLELASRWYREIVMTFMKADRAVRPAWPQHMQRDIFDIRGLTAQLLLPSGQDYGGLKRTLEAYCATFKCKAPEWTVNWKCERREHCPEFRLLPAREPGGYSALQLLAVFKALRFNDYFKALSFRDVDFSPLCGLTDVPGWDESVADVNRDGLVIDGAHRDILKSAPLLSQEIHAVAFTSGSVRKIDLTNVLASRNIVGVSRTRAGSKKEPEVVRPILLLLKTGSIPCDTLLVGGNPLTAAEVDDLVDVLHIPDLLKELDISRCNLDEKSLEEIWDALPSQGYKMEALNTSRNIGHVDHMVVKSNLSHFICLRKLGIAGSCLSQFRDPIFFDETIMRWGLEELDLSNINLNDATLQVLGNYLQCPEANYLRRLDLNNCGMTGTQIAELFNSMGQGRVMTCSISGNYLETGTEALANAIACNFGPTSLFMDMIEFQNEKNYIRIIKALSLNRTIRLLSLVGTSTPGQVSEEACMAVSDFFATNQSVQYLDFSGFSAKLDEGQLGLGFSRSLSGLAENTGLRHLRIRNQKLNLNIGDLAHAIHLNQTLTTLDVQENNFNLSNLSHMAKALDQNSSIQEFCPFSRSELNAAVKSSVQNVGMPTGQPSSARARRASKVLSKAAFENFAMEMDKNNTLMQNLKDEWSVKTAQIDRVLERNRTLSLEKEMARMQWDPQEESQEDWITLELGNVFGGLAVKAMKTRRKIMQPGYRGSVYFGDNTPPLEPTQEFGAYAAPHHVTREEVIESPATEGASGSSGLPTPPEWAPAESSIKEYAIASSAPQSCDAPRILDENADDFDLSLLKHMIQHGFALDEATQAQSEDVDRKAGTTVSTTTLR
ncbi:leucine rich repeat protein [Colletotrichum graminicola]|uniref:Leucine rich repeat protein n=1 Tax=Colletotrichum graminicola (strain M1.001 / M2 / FGSC 10212) TaxID=645133 RepID=E3Q2Z8_COLGM|nr:leucine rich repeat protein [Colletotrichum graminicola M1.001]EFQ24977.1 leucine rich repeat protein [Colletotrichum graminicola M1.001]WDK15459.1 leucine rich repeat protein [Colletotrichum graminicola]